MKTHRQCKLAGLSSLEEFSEIIGTSTATINNWNKSKGTKNDKSILLKCALIGASIIKKRQKQQAMELSMEWVKVDDSLPESGKPVMITDGESIVIGTNTEFGYWIPSGVEAYNNAKIMLSMDVDNITHWAELTNLPKVGA